MSLLPLLLLLLPLPLLLLLLPLLLLLLLLLPLLLLLLPPKSAFLFSLRPGALVQESFRITSRTHGQEYVVATKGHKNGHRRHEKSTERCENGYLRV